MMKIHSCIHTSICITYYWTLSWKVSYIYTHPIYILYIYILYWSNILLGHIYIEYYLTFDIRHIWRIYIHVGSIHITYFQQNPLLGEIYIWCTSQVSQSSLVLPMNLFVVSFSLITSNILLGGRWWFGLNVFLWNQVSPNHQ